ncbi:MAG: acetyl-CoA carboxylase carboxyl transferase subunit beta [Candidatus Omnitrophica bacterium CG11_big_fil_rev_8_21_14_0_20_45_26]|uniref:Acetyl-coenzyme A carboxylase carboxyl transferase subunit beta n=1 Tax=Candidatus Abzuiibacterium crystallinum TaxID=1974748 RepID=A0A2H0LLU8_9BACT|nr:MAG: acetyl-CoA carboxylase carboxyl transferase subunit beta [Candidatus Omnitrophica bacterium CG11_big_fil_rev_8_21_14_0_20_45_26]PIW63274.1 MAG: acetyl-CoA carboxylase carboxyl transferase subunit beta [Candidatus Omnitrophica bacterium CG12_big_fil_rev_8_21_14_0_65_45_16]
MHAEQDIERQSGEQEKSVNVPAKKKSVPEGLWTKCPQCTQVIFSKTLAENLSVCPKCRHHFVIGAKERIGQLIDAGTFNEKFANLTSLDPLRFKGPKSYAEKVTQDQKKTDLKEAVIVGQGEINGVKAAIAVTDSRFIMGSMGSVVGEKITRLVEFAAQKKMPLIIVSGSGGGARMYEGALSLMQMAKTSGALARYNKTSLPFISVLTNPTMGGVMASFASLGDFILAEPKALIGFAGPRVIEQTIRQKLPHNFQTSEFLLEHGLIDCVVERNELKNKISKLLEYCTGTK